ncbi:Uncharacterised protein [Mycobacterium tuberculosis]|nr:Uncharacterised protein [Mycobacterium tuberculosis]
MHAAARVRALGPRRWVPGGFTMIAVPYSWYRPKSPST